MGGSVRDRLGPPRVVPASGSGERLRRHATCGQRAADGGERVERLRERRWVNGKRRCCVPRRVRVALPVDRRKEGVRHDSDRADQPSSRIRHEQARDEIGRFGRDGAVGDGCRECEREDGAVDLAHLGALEGWEPEEELVDDDTKGPPVRCGLEAPRLASDRLWSHVERRAHDRRVLGDIVGAYVLACGDVRQPKVGQLEPPRRAEQHVLWLEVAVDDAARVQVLESEEHVGEEGTRVVLGHRAMGLQHVLAVLLQPLHHKVQRVLVLEREESLHHERRGARE
mmetsp:Transcript_43462/g.114205  ORF Transcript_43462/g.114205 Transcript_43462/m.114205 type:complete len:283 (-) Transcript_43462:2675-3523(-)